MVRSKVVALSLCALVTAGVCGCSGGPSTESTTATSDPLTKQSVTCTLTQESFTPTSYKESGGNYKLTADVTSDVTGDITGSSLRHMTLIGHSSGNFEFTGDETVTTSTGTLTLNVTGSGNGEDYSGNVVANGGTGSWASVHGQGTLVGNGPSATFALDLHE